MFLLSRLRKSIRRGTIYFPYNSALFIRYRLHSDLSCRFELCTNPTPEYKSYYLTGITLRKLWLKDRNEANLRIQLYLDSVLEPNFYNDDSDLDKRVVTKFINIIYVFYKNLLKERRDY